MLCKKPFYPGGAVSYPCGQCTPCRVNRGRLWAHRLILEGMRHGSNTVATLTISNDWGPPTNSLRPTQVQRWLKRLRKALAPREVRYFLVGEYGDQFGRPHYHVILYNVDPVVDANTIRQTWGQGHVHLDSLTWESAAYTCQYVLKKMTKSDDYTETYLQGRHPEFSRMSRRPGIAAHLMETLASRCTDAATAKAIGTSMDVPTVLQHGRRTLPLGRYLRRRLRMELLGTAKDESGEPQAAKEKKARELRALCEAIGTAEAMDTLKLHPEAQRILNLERKLAIHKPRSSL